MEKEKIVDAILESLRDEVSQFIEEEAQMNDSIEYEERVLDLSRMFARKLVIGSQGEMPKSRNLKKKC